MGQRDHLGARAKQPLELIEQELASVRNRRPLDYRTKPLAQEVPRHDVGVVLQDRQHDLVASLDVGHAPTLRDDVDSLGRILGEDDFFPSARVEEPPRCLARILILLRRRIRQVMDAAMHVGVFEAIAVIHRLDHGFRLLRRRSVIEINQRPIVNLAK